METQENCKGWWLKPCGQRLKALPNQHCKALKLLHPIFDHVYDTLCASYVIMSCVLILISSLVQKLLSEGFDYAHLAETLKFCVLVVIDTW